MTGGRQAPVLEHVTLDLRGDPNTVSFYRAALGALGLAESRDGEGRVGWGSNGEFGVYESADEFFQRTHIAFAAASPEVVDRAYRAAIEAGGSSVDEPRHRPEFGAETYSAYLRDPAGNNLEIIFRGR
jgi:catechol 2,3-dioxygenase-like lactoylglutathione lyase family enzyme